MTNFLTRFPEPEELLKRSLHQEPSFWPVNGHIHTPFSFSAFMAIDPIFEMAVGEGIKILGINDFYTTKGYREFHDQAVRSRVFPLFNIEYIALDRELQKKGVRVNDPNNPGRTYFSGKGLDFPDTLDARHAGMVETVIAESMRQVESMVVKTNSVLSDLQSDIRLDFEEIRRLYARELVRERHIAKALRIAIYERYPDTGDRTTFLQRLYDGKELKANPASNASVENEIRNNLLKAGGRAFVEEDEKAFLSVDMVIEIITHAGGIPCYPVLLDDAKGNFTDYEGSKEAFLSELTARNIFCIELIPGRNDATILEDFVKFFDSKGFIILFGTEHNTPEMIPLTVSCRHQAPLSESLKKISSDGALLIAAHQYLRTKTGDSAMSRWNQLNTAQRQGMLNLGRAVFQHFQNT